MKNSKNVFTLTFLMVIVFFLAGCGILPTPTPTPTDDEGVLTGQVMAPEGTAMAKQLTGQALANATVNIIDPDTGEVIATTTTDENGNYEVNVPEGGPYVLQAQKDNMVIQQVTPEVEAGKEYDLGTADETTTAIALIAQAMLEAEDFPDDLADIDLGAIENDPNFDDVLDTVQQALLNGENPAQAVEVIVDVWTFLYPDEDAPPAPSPPGPTPPKDEYHTYKFNIDELAAEYVVIEDGFVGPDEDDFSDMTPVGLSIVVDEEKDKAYDGMVRVAAVGADNLQLWAKDTSNNWWDINEVGWGPAEGFTIDPNAVTNVYVVPTAVLENQKITLELLDITGDYGATDDIIISQDESITAIPPVFNGTVYGVINTSDQGEVTGTLTDGDFDLEIEGNVTVYTDNIATFNGTVTGDINGDVTATINAQGIDTLYGTIENTGATETVRIIGTFPQSGIDGDFAGQIITGEELPAVTDISIAGDDVVAVGDTIILSAEITPADATDKVLWSIFVNHSDVAEIDSETGVLTGLKDGTATVIVKTLDDSHVSHATKAITVVDGDVINVTQKKGYETIQNAISEAADNDTLVLNSDITISETDFMHENGYAVMISGKFFTLDLNGKTLSAPANATVYISSNSGELTLKDSVSGGQIRSTAIEGVAVGNYGKFIMESGELVSENLYALYNYYWDDSIYGIAIIYDGILKGGDRGIANCGILTISDGIITGTDNYDIDNSGKLIFSGDMIFNKMLLRNGSDAPDLADNGTMVIESGVTISGKDTTSTIDIEESATININGTNNFYEDENQLNTDNIPGNIFTWDGLNWLTHTVL